MSKRISFIPIYPILLAVQPIINLYVTNHHLVRFYYFLIPLVIIILLSLILVIVLKNIQDLGGIYVPLSALILGLVFHYGAVFEAIATLPSGHIYQKDYILLPIWISIFSIAAVLLYRLRNHANISTPILNIISIAIVLAAVIKILETRTDITSEPGLYKPVRDISKGTIQVNGHVEMDQYPDVYYIILDGYGRADILRDLYKFSNDEFLSALTEIGFYVASQSRSNYSQTSMSIASSLNSMYLDDLGVLDKRLSTMDRSLIQQKLVRESLVTRKFQQLGYTTVIVDSGFSFFTSNIPDVNITYPFRGIDEFIWNVSDTTLIRAIFPTTIQKSRYDGISAMFDSMSEVPNIEGPTFTLAHVPIPHPPYLFDESGSFTKSTGFEGVDGNGWLPRSSYIDQVEYVNKLVEDLVNEITEASKAEPIIVIQADHGPMSTWMEPKETLPILNALYLPRNGANYLYPSISPVNTFRLIFDLYFGSDYGLKEDRSYWANYQFKHDLLCESKMPANGILEFDILWAILSGDSGIDSYKLSVDDCEFEIIQQLDDGLYDLEKSGDTFFRWAGQEARFTLPVIANEAHYLEFGVTGVFADANSIMVSIDGVPVGTSNIVNGFQEIKIFIPGEFINNQEYIDLSVSHSFVNYSISPRPLSIMYHSIGIVPVLEDSSSQESVFKDNPLVINELSGDIIINRVASLAQWTIEKYGDQTLLWLGEGEEQGLEIILIASKEKDLNIGLSLEPGPSRSDSERTVMIKAISEDGANTYINKISGSSVQEIVIHLSKGLNTIHIYSNDKATINEQPNGDLRSLLVLLRSVTISNFESN